MPAPSASASASSSPADARADATIQDGAPHDAEAPARDFGLPDPGQGWKAREAQRAFGYVSMFYGGCRGPQACGTLEPAASWEKDGMKLSAFSSKGDQSGGAPGGVEGQSARKHPDIPGLGIPYYEMKSDGVLFLWTTVPHFVIEAQGPFHTFAEEKKLRDGFGGWVRRIAAPATPDRH